VAPTLPRTTNGRRNLDNIPLNAVDIAVALILLVSAILAYARGFVHETLAVAGWVGAFLATVKGYPYLQPYARDMIPADLLADFAAGVSIFVVTLVILTLITRAISSRVKESALNVLDRSLGFLFGLVRGAVVICAAYIGLGLLIPQEEQPDWVTEAKSLPLIVDGSQVLASLLPEDAQIEIPDIGAKDVMDVMEIVQPSPKNADDKTEEDAGYGEDSRKGIEQLIENTQ